MTWWSNVCKQKHVTNMRNASASEDSLRLVSVHPLTLEECLEFIDDDELLEITPKSLRMRKRVLSHEERARAAHRAKGWTLPAPLAQASKKEVVYV